MPVKGWLGKMAAEKLSMVFMVPSLWIGIWHLGKEWVVAVVVGSMGLAVLGHSIEGLAARVNGGLAW